MVSGEGRLDSRRDREDIHLGRKFSEPTGHPLDALDRRILVILLNNARLSARAIARELEVSPGTVVDRLERMEGSGVIIGYHAVVDPVALGFDLEVVVGLRTDQGDTLKQALGHLKAIPYVESVRIVSGAWDLLVTMQVHDHDHLRELLLSNLWKVPGFRHSETLLVLQRCESEPARLLQEPSDDNIRN